MAFVRADYFIELQQFYISIQHYRDNEDKNSSFKGSEEIVASDLKSNKYWS